MADTAPARPVVLCVVDGFGEHPESKGNAWREAATPNLDALRARYPSTLLAASGPAVGLGEGEPGNGQVGHLAMGTGRMPATTLALIDDCIRRRKLATVPMIVQTLRIAADRKARLHLIGLVSEGRGHSSLDHLYTLLDLADFHEVPVVLHVVLDGRDSGPRSAVALLDRIAVRLEGRGVVGTVSGRHYAMDTGEQWDRTYRAFQAIVRDKALGPEAPTAETPFDALQNAYREGLDDDFVVPTRIGDYQGIAGDFLCDFAAAKPVWEWTGEEVGLCWNHRPDGLRSLISMLTRRGLPREIVVDLLTDRGKPVLAFDDHCFATLTCVDPSFRLPVAFESAEPLDALGDWIARAGLEQLRIAEEPKAAHIAEFFDGRHVPPRAGERRVPLPLPLEVERLAERPGARSADIARQVCAAVRGGTPFVLALLGGAELVAREGDPAAALLAVEAVDRSVGEIAQAVHECGGTLVLTSDHGSCEVMRDSQGKRDGRHTTNPVPLVVAGERYVGRSLAAGSLVDVAPTLLALLGLEVPTAVTGGNLLVTPDRTGSGGSAAPLTEASPPASAAEPSSNELATGKRGPT